VENYETNKYSWTIDVRYRSGCARRVSVRDRLILAEGGSAKRANW